MINYNTVEEALEELKKGKIILVTDAPDRENEGDLICAAEFATPENINFMATYGKGLICMPMSGERAEKLGLSAMVHRNTDNHETAFTVSIDHVETTTGISAFERSVTAVKSAGASAEPKDFRRPGHMFPLIAKEFGVLQREGHTEVTVDLMKLAGLADCGICCEVMREDGTMMRAVELAEMSRRFNMPFITIEAVKDYIKARNFPVEKVVETKLPTKYGEFKTFGFVNKINGEHHLAMCCGDVEHEEAPICRLHSECLTGDALGSVKCDCGEQYHAAMKMIEKNGSGIMLYMRQEGRGIGLINKLKAYKLQEEGMDTVEANLALGFEEDQRDYSIAAAMLKNLGITKIKLITNNPDKIKQLKKYGIEIAERIPVEMAANPYDIFYLKTKQRRMGHMVNYVNKSESL